MINLVQVVQVDPVLSLEQAIAALPKDKMLGGTLEDLLRHPKGADVSEADLLNKARIARNFVAHEGASVAPIWSARKKDLVEHSTRLRSADADLVAGDNLVSAWCYEIEEKERAPRLFMLEYPDMVNTWVFGELDLLLARMDLEDDHEPSMFELLQQRAKA